MSKEDLFHSFLLERDIVGAYRLSFTNLVSPGQGISEFLNSTSPFYYIYWAFSWSDSIEGTAFWQGVNSDWTKIVQAEEMADGNL